jgi:hypothetical protein
MRVHWAGQTQRLLPDLLGGQHQRSVTRHHRASNSGSVREIPQPYEQQNKGGQDARFRWITE